jgi:RHS repeat-associated protein
MRYDPLTGLYDAGRREYKPTLMRFLSPDPIMFGSGRPNFYQYVGNDPTNATDPSGLTELWFGDKKGQPLPENKNQFMMYAKDAEDHWVPIGIYDKASNTVRNGMYQVPYDQMRAALKDGVPSSMFDWWRANGDYIKPIWERVPDGNAPLLQQWRQIDPQLDHNARQGFGQAGVLANVGVIWVATGPEFLSLSGTRFVLKNGRWVNKANEAIEATLPEAAAANQALARYRSNQIARHVVQESPARFGRDVGQIEKIVDTVINNGAPIECKSGAIIYHHAGNSVIWRPTIGKGTMVIDPKGNTARNWLAIEGGLK